MASHGKKDMPVLCEGGRAALLAGDPGKRGKGVQHRERGRKQAQKRVDCAEKKERSPTTTP